mgnify:CR=1 FL=1
MPPFLEVPVRAGRRTWPECKPRQDGATELAFVGEHGPARPDRRSAQPTPSQTLLACERVSRALQAGVASETVWYARWLAEEEDGKTEACSAWCPWNMHHWTRCLSGALLCSKRTSSSPIPKMLTKEFVAGCYTCCEIYVHRILVLRLIESSCA